MAVVPGSSDVFAQQKLADEKCTRTYIFHHNIAAKSKKTAPKLIHGTQNRQVKQGTFIIDLFRSRSF